MESNTNASNYDVAYISKFFILHTMIYINNIMLKQKNSLFTTSIMIRITKFPLMVSYLN